MATEAENRRRAFRAKAALAPDYAQDSPSLEDGITDLLADLCHYCDTVGLPAGALMRQALAHHEAETGGEP